ncbi:MAG TPA: malonic semialdehyde reductase [Burkholderiales bacterium]|jgi:3-hydroxypropanoate dehydrogenase
MSSVISDAVIDQLFRTARTQNGWASEPVTDAQLKALYDIYKMGPTSGNNQPARVQFVRSAEAKARLLPCMSPGNQEKTKTAPVTAIIGYDVEFYHHLPRLFPHNPAMKDNFAGPGKEAAAQAAAFRNGTLQGAYLMIAARMIGLDVGGMSGFDAAKVDAEFWAGTTVKTNFMVNLGHGDPAAVKQRLPRFDFDEINRII